MSEASETETYKTFSNDLPAAETPAEVGTPQKSGSLLRTLLVVGAALASAALVFAVIRATLSRTPADPTTERIQALIDEANRLLKQLDDKNTG